MLDGLPKLLGRDFIIGFYLPATAFVVGLAALNVRFGYFSASEVTLLQSDQPWLGVTLLALALWLFALLLVVANRSLLRLMAGYWPLTRAVTWARRRQERRLAKVEKEIASLRTQRHNALDERSRAALEANLTRRTSRRHIDFPADADWVRPTAFGNAVQAFETYSTKVYGVENAEVWPRLLYVIPADARELLAESRAQVNFAANAFGLSLTFSLTWLLSAVVDGFKGGWTAWLLDLFAVVVGVLMAYLASASAKAMAIEWGRRVKAAYDVYLPDLGKRLGIEGHDHHASRAAWNGMSLAMLMQEPQYLPQSADKPESRRPSLAERVLVLFRRVFGSAEDT